MVADRRPDNRVRVEIGETDCTGGMLGNDLRSNGGDGHEGIKVRDVGLFAFLKLSPFLPLLGFLAIATDYHKDHD